jgi:outer membrane receptor for ferrienterochelin and colicin
MKSRRLPFIFTCLFFSLISNFLYGQVDTTGINKLFEMSLSDLLNQEVITTSKFAQKSAEAASSIIVITSDEIRYFNYSTLAEALNSCPGIYISNDKNYTYVGSRGFSRPTDYNNRILIMIDGHVFNEVVYGSAFMGNELGLDLKNIKRIEIIRGPGASVYGSGAMLNVVNIIMKKGYEINALQLSTGLGSFGRKDFSAEYGKQIGNFNVSASAIGGLYNGQNYYFPELNSSETNYGISRDMDWEKYGGFHAKIENENFSLSGAVTSRIKGVPTGAYQTNLTGDVSSTDNRGYIEAGFKKNLTMKSSMFVKAYYDSYHYTGSWPIGTWNDRDAGNGKWAGSEVQYYLEAGEKNIITAGLEYKYIFRANYKEWDDSNVYFNDNFPFTFLSLYAQDQFKILDNFILTGGLRFDQYSIFGNSLSPRLSMVYQYSDVSSVKILYSEAFRIPNIYESFYRAQDDHESNPHIKPEKIRSIELAWGHKISDSFYLSASLYRFYMHNLIDLTSDTITGLTKFINIGKTLGTGIEAELRFQPGIKSSGYFNVSLQRAKDELSGTRLTNSPDLMIKSGWIWPVYNKLFIAPEFFFETGRETLKGNMTDNVYLFNLSLRTAKFLKYFDIAFKIRNIFDNKYKYPGGYEHAQDALIQDRRNLYLQLNAKF